MGKKVYYSVSDISKKWHVAERTVRYYCEEGRVPGSIIQGKTWLIPSDAEKPARQKRHSKFSKNDNILTVLKREKDARLKGGIYHRVQIALTYNSSHIEGSKLTESFIKQLHFILKSGTTDSMQSWFKVGGYKLLENEVGNSITAKPSEVPQKMKALLQEYNAKKITLEDILDFHVQFEKIHPFQDGNGRIGRLIMFKECLKHNFVPFIITDEVKLFYYRGISEWNNLKGYLTDTCLSCQEEFKAVLKKFEIPFKE